MRYALPYTLISLLLMSAASAQTPQQSEAQTDTEKQALAYEVQECITAKVRTTSQAFLLQTKLQEVTKRAEAAEKRAAEAEAKLKPSSAPAQDK